MDDVTFPNARSKSFGSSEAPTSRAVSRKRLWRSASVSLGFRGLRAIGGPQCSISGTSNSFMPSGDFRIEKCFEFESGSQTQGHRYSAVKLIRSAAGSGRGGIRIKRLCGSARQSRVADSPGSSRSNEPVPRGASAPIRPVMFFKLSKRRPPEKILQVNCMSMIGKRPGLVIKNNVDRGSFSSIAVAAVISTLGR